MAFIRGGHPEHVGRLISIKQQSKVSKCSNFLEWINYLEVRALRPEGPNALDSAVEHLLVQLLIQLRELLERL